jgi:hypothetical protein
MSARRAVFPIAITLISGRSAQFSKSYAVARPVHMANGRMADLVCCQEKINDQ